MDIRARRVFRQGAATALSLVLACALEVELHFLPPLFAFLMTATPGRPPGPRALLSLLLVTALATGTGLLLVPLLQHQPLAGVLLMALGLFWSFLLTVHLQQPLLGQFLAVGFTLVTAAGVASQALGELVVVSLLAGIAIATLCLWLVYPLFPEDAETAPVGDGERRPAIPLWISLRGTLTVLPVALLALSNPSLYLAAIMKSISLSQQATATAALHAGRELVGSTVAAALMAIAFWVVLKLMPGLWMYGLLMLLFALWTSARLQGVVPTRQGPGFWLGAFVTMLILLGPAVADSQQGKDVYAASLVRLSLFLAVTLYGWWMMAVLEMLRSARSTSLRQLHASGRSPTGC